MKTVYIIHGWEGSPNEPMHKWLREELESKGYKVIAPRMPNAERPEIKSWVNRLTRTIKSPDKDTILVGHSIGCQAILRYLETTPPTTLIGGVVLIAPFFTLRNLENDGEREIIEPWLEMNINFEDVKKHTHKITAIFSDNDDFVPLENAELFKVNLETKNIIENNKGHFTKGDGVKQLPSALYSVLSID